MKIAIIFGTTEGQTQKICQFAMDALTAEGHSVALMPAAAAAGVTLDAFDAAILGASVHAGRYQSDLVAFAKAHAEELNGLSKSLFISVSLAAAGNDPDDLAGIALIARHFRDETGWSPERTEQVAGAFRFSEYDFLKYWAMRWIEAQKDPASKPGEDREYTDWESLRQNLHDWTAS